MDNNSISVRPFFRVLYAILSLFGIFCIFLPFRVLYKVWQLNLIETWGIAMWLMLIVMLFMGICFTYTGFVIAKSGKPPKYLVKYLEKYKQKV
jgi:hypothetical protein